MNWISRLVGKYLGGLISHFGLPNLTWPAQISARAPRLVPQHAWFPSHLTESNSQKAEKVPAAGGDLQDT